MSQYSESYAPRTGEFAAEPSVTDVARDEATDVAQHARQAGGQVTQTATDQARQVAAETSRQVRDLLGEAQGEVRDQLSAQQRTGAKQLHSVADELGQMAASGGQAGMATEFARQAAGRLHDAASWLEQREPADLLDEVRKFARRRPGTFLIGAALAGLAAGRLTRGLAAGSDEGSGGNRAASGNGQPGGSRGTEPAYPVGTGDPAGQGYPEGAAPIGAAPAYRGVDPAYTNVDPAYPAAPAYPSELGGRSRPEGAE